jgi:hypothetical protein
LRKDFWVFFKKNRCSSFGWGVFSQVFSVQLGLEREVSLGCLSSVSRLSLVVSRCLSLGLRVHALVSRWACAFLLIARHAKAAAGENYFSGVF